MYISFSKSNNATSLLSALCVSRKKKMIAKPLSILECYGIRTLCLTLLKLSHKLSFACLWPLLCSREQVVSNLLEEQKYSTKQLELKEHPV